MEGLTNVFNQLSKYIERSTKVDTGTKNHSLRIEAGNEINSKETSNKDSNSNADLQEEKPKAKRKKRLKPIPPEFMSLLRDKKDKYGIGTSLLSKSGPKPSGRKVGKTLEERIHKRAPDSKQDSKPNRFLRERERDLYPSSSLRTKNAKQVYVACIRKVPENEECPKKTKAKKELNVKSPRDKVNSNSSKTKPSTSCTENLHQKSMHIDKSQRTNPINSFPRSQKKSKPTGPVSFCMENKKCHKIPACAKKIEKKNCPLQPDLSEMIVDTKPIKKSSSTQIKAIEFKCSFTDQQIKNPEIKHEIPVKKSASNTSSFQNKKRKRCRSASPTPQTNIEQQQSTISSEEKSRALISPPPPHNKRIPKKVESRTSLRKRNSSKTKINPKQILVSLFKKAGKKCEDMPLKKCDSKTKDPKVEKKEGKAKKAVKLKAEEVEPSTVLKKDSKQKLNSTPVTENQSKQLEKSGNVQYKIEDFKNLFTSNFLKSFMRPFQKNKSKEKLPIPITDQIRAHAFRKNPFKIVARINKELSLKAQIKQIAPSPFPRVHGYTQPVLAKFKCGRLKEKEEDILKERKKLKKKFKKQITEETSRTELKSEKSKETVSSSKHILKTTESTTSKTSQIADTKNKKHTKKKKENGGEEDKEDEDDEVENVKSATTIITTTTTTVKTVETVKKQVCPYFLSNVDGKKCTKRCCCQFLKSLPPTPRETFRQNPGNPHFYPAPGFKRAWGYDVQRRRLERLEEERQRLCAEERGIPYNGPVRQYQDLFDETPVEDRCCCNSCKEIKSENADPNSFECNAADPHMYPTVAGYKHYYDIKEDIKKADQELEELRKECEDTFPDIKPVIERKTKPLQCRGAILSGEKDRQEKIKEIVSRMVAICKCLDECDCKAALQAREPYNLDENRAVCCCSRKLYEEGGFDCNAGDPHYQPTVSAFRHTFDFRKKKKERIANRKSIYDEIVQYGTEEEIKEARISLYKQMIEDGTKEEKEVARISLEKEETREDDVCDCPEIQEIVVMIEDSDCEDDQLCCSYPPQRICEFGPICDEGAYLRQNILEYPENYEGWEPLGELETPNGVLDFEQPREKLEKETKTPSGELSLPTPSQTQRISETQTPRTSHTQTENVLEIGLESDEQVLKNYTESVNEANIEAVRKNKCKSIQKTDFRIRKVPKTGQPICPPRSCPRIKPKCVCFSDKKSIICKERKNAAQVQKPTHTCHPEKPRKQTSDATEKLKCSDISQKSLRRKSECICISQITDEQKSIDISDIPEDRSKYHSICGKRKSQRKCVRLSEDADNDTNTVLSDTNWSSTYEEADIYYPPPAPCETEYQNFYEPTNSTCYPTCCELGEREMFNTAPPKCSNMYQEFPKNNICPEKDMTFSIQIEQENAGEVKNVYLQKCTPDPIEDLQTSFHLICINDEGKNEEEFCCKAKRKKDCPRTVCACKTGEKISCCKQHARRIPCRCNDKVSCKYPNEDFGEPFERLTLDTSDIQNEPIKNIKPILKKEKKKSRWPFWKCVHCKDGKDRFLKTSVCPTPRRTCAADKNLNCKYRENTDEMDICREYAKNKTKGDVNKSVIKNSGRISHKRKSYTNKKTRQSEKVEMFSAGDANKRTSKDSERIKTERIKYKEKKKSRWPFWKCVNCEDEKERFLKTSVCSTPRGTCAADQKPNCKYGKNTDEMDIYGDINKCVIGNSRRLSHKRKSYINQKNHEREMEILSCSDENKRISNDSERCRTERINYEETYENMKRIRKPNTLRSCYCKKTDNSCKCKEQLSCRCKKPLPCKCLQPTKKKLVCRKDGICSEYLSCQMEPEAEMQDEYMLVVETVDPPYECEINKPIELFPIDPCAPPPPCECKASNQKTKSFESDSENYASLEQDKRDSQNLRPSFDRSIRNSKSSVKERKSK